MLTEVKEWLASNFSAAAEWPADRLLAAKSATGATVSVVLPALDEEETVGEIVAALRRDLVAAAPLIDELVVIDSGSTDRTAAAATAAGARVVHRDEVLHSIPAVPGKGEVLWRSLAVTSGDIICFVDSDLRDFSSSVVRGILGPLLADPSIMLVKGAYDRPLRDGASVLPAGGGRVTELVARPLLNLHWPELAGFVQPLGGEYAARRSLLEALPFPCGYGVELALLIDAYRRCGLAALAQVDVGVRLHSHQSDAALGRMASEIMQAALARLDSDIAVHAILTQFARSDDGFESSSHDVSVLERPPLASLGLC